MNAVDYDRRMREILAENEGGRLLLHCCCAPCSSYCLGEVAQRMKVTVLFYNPNLDSEEEYLRRKGELVRFLHETGLADALDCDYAPEQFERIARGYEAEREGGARCERCFRLRLERTAEEAEKGGFDFFATTLTVSPLKNARLINEIGFSLGNRARYLPTDFKKRGGYLRSVELSREYGLYRQDYCGCIYSRSEREQKKRSAAGGEPH